MWTKCVLMGSPGALLAMILLAALPAGCGGPPDDGEPNPVTCGPGEVERIGVEGCCQAGEMPLQDGRCLPAGMQQNGCAAGEAAVEGGPIAGGTCRAAGIPPEMCGEGFEPDGEGGCDPILPAEPCPKGMMAIPGETECHEVAPCGAGRWGDIPVEANTQFVDGSYGGENGPSDGSEQRPWTKIQQGLIAADPGAIVAVADGFYPEHLTISAPRRLWGRCPAAVEVVGPEGEAAILVQLQADGAVVTGLSVRGAGIGVLMTEVADVVVEKVWIHDTTLIGLSVIDLGATSMLLRSSIVELAGVTGAFIGGSTATIEGSVIRDTQLSSMGGGEGVVASNDPDTGRRASLTVISSVVERNNKIGIFVDGSDAIVERSVVRDTEPSAATDPTGWGIGVSADPDKDKDASLVVRTSVIERNHAQGIFAGAETLVEATAVRDTLSTPSTGKHGVGIGVHADPRPGRRTKATVRWSTIAHNQENGVSVVAADAELQGVLIRETEPRDSGEYGWGLVVLDDVDTGDRSALDLRSSVIERSVDLGMMVGGSDAMIEGTAVRDTAPRATDGQFGRGISIQQDPDTGQRSAVTMAGCAVEDNHDVGVIVDGSDADIAATVVRGTKSRMSDLAFGRGVQYQDDPETGARTSGSLRSCLIDGNREVGVMVGDSDVTVDTTAILGTLARESDGLFGDGFAAASLSTEPANSVVVRTRIEKNARAAVAGFSAIVSIEATLSECNELDLAAEHIGDAPVTLQDLGDNVCGCGEQSVACQAKTFNLEPPDAAPLTEVPPGGG